MTPELEALETCLRTTLDDIVAAVAGLSEEELNRAPAIPMANSCFVIATHVLGNVRAQVLGIACGLDIHRVRPEEFKARGSLTDLQASSARLSQEMAEALATLEPSKLDERLVPSQELWGEGVPHEQSRREALLHPLEHAGIHLGQILLTVDLLKQARGS